MATVLPPPSKRQRVEASEKARAQVRANEVPDGLGSVRVQFIDQTTGNGTGPAIGVSIANATVKNLETLLNSIQGNVGIRILYQNMSDLRFPRTRMKEYPTDSPSNPPDPSWKMAQPLSTSSQIFIAQF
jgi:hypothetical protein